MGRKRTVIVDGDEDIVSYEHNIASGFVRALVGVGTTNADGSFTVADSQTFENIIIQDDDYTNLMTAKGSKPAKSFRKDDLWDFIDIIRARKNVKP